jgi:hypothetical protein
VADRLSDPSIIPIAASIAVSRERAQRSLHLFELRTPLTRQSRNHTQLLFRGHLSSRIKQKNGAAPVVGAQALPRSCGVRSRRSVVNTYKRPCADFVLPPCERLPARGPALLEATAEGVRQPPPGANSPRTNNNPRGLGGANRRDGDDGGKIAPVSNTRRQASVRPCARRDQAPKPSRTPGPPAYRQCRRLGRSPRSARLH